MTNPEDLAAAHFKEVRQARERTAKAEAALARSRERCEELRRQLTRAELRDREALGQALVDGKAEPVSEAEQVKAELAHEEERTAALVAAVEASYREIPRLVNEHRTAWKRQGYRALSKAQGRYEKAIVELEAAREEMDGEATLLVWLNDGTMSSAATDSLGGRFGSEAVSFVRTIAVLREDCEHLAAYRGGTSGPALDPRYELAWTDRR